MSLLPNNCLKCSTLMVRTYRSAKHNRKKKKTGFSEWDVCPNCGFIQHYEMFRLKRRKGQKTIKTPKAYKRNKKKKPFKRPKYSIYIKSVKWKKRRERYWKEHGRDCKACGSTDKPTVHHVHYGYLGREEDEHIIGLCWDCHQDFHSQYGVNTTMQDETLEFIETKQLEMMQL